MDDRQGYYALIQFSDRPERFEFVNIGLALWYPAKDAFVVRFSDNLRRAERLFGRLASNNQSSYDDMKSSFEHRLCIEFKNLRSIELLNKFADLRANKIRLLRFQPILIESLEDDFNDLFEDLVGDARRRPRKQQIRTALRHRMEKAGVSHYLEKPRPVELPQGVRVSAQYGYQNGSYNLIDGVRLGGNPDVAVREASKRAIEGQWLIKHSRFSGAPKKLIVVADASEIKDNLYRAIDDLMREKEVRLYRLDEISSLVEDIRENGMLHQVSNHQGGLTG